MDTAVRVVLPGDLVASSSISPFSHSERIIGAGLNKHENGRIYAAVGGTLNERGDKLWITSANKRYAPKAGDRILGVITAKAGDYLRVDIGGPDLAQLSFISFEGATKRNRPTAKVGDLIYCQVTLCAKNMEPEVSCIDAESKARGMGVVHAPGLVISVDLKCARRLLAVEETFLSELGKQIKFETIVGMNGRIWISGGLREVLAAKDAVLEWAAIASTNTSSSATIIASALKRARGVTD